MHMISLLGPDPSFVMQSPETDDDPSPESWEQSQLQPPRPTKVSQTSCAPGSMDSTLVDVPWDIQTRVNYLSPDGLVQRDSTGKADAKTTTGTSVFSSTIVKYETSSRVRLLLYGSAMLSRGRHSSVVFGHAAAATSVGELLGLNPDSPEDLAGIACT
ncbi:hypothetical protein BJX66DRAFT_342094 [Aspergillus keveii]|uniref:Uncharacterized protein n=1 Tax=Aspergillus keveii TaxID=714993 RepID=A0ABR4FTB6_9EURO